MWSVQSAIGHQSMSFRTQFSPKTIDMHQSRSLYQHKYAPTRPQATPNTQQDGIFSPSNVDTPLVRIFAPIAIGLGLAMLLDAAYSGDWSRIGVLTKDQELFLQNIIVPISFGSHAVLAVVAAVISKQRGEERWLLRGAKTFVGGVTTLIEVVTLPDEVKA